jgi:hypothetical protein
MIARFPCKINPPHFMHVCDIRFLLNHYQRVIVDILVVDGVSKVWEHVRLLEQAFSKHDLQRIKFELHLKSYTGIKIETLNDEVVVSGNEAVLQCQLRAGNKVQQLRVAPGYSSTILRNAAKK